MEHQQTQPIEAPPAPEPAAKPQVRPFAAVLQEHRRGSLHTELSEAMQNVVLAALQHGKTGEVILKLKVKPTGDEGMVFITDDVIVKAPRGERPSGVFFADDDGNLTRTDPRQPELPLREVPRESGEVRQLPADAEQPRVVGGDA